MFRGPTRTLAAGEMGVVARVRGVAHFRAPAKLFARLMQGNPQAVTRVVVATVSSVLSLRSGSQMPRCHCEFLNHSLTACHWRMNVNAW